MSDGWAGYLNAAMASAGFTRPSDLARAAGIKQPLISRWLDGTSIPDVASLRKLAKPLGVTLLELMVAAGHLTPAEAHMKSTPRKPPAPDVTKLTDDELLHELSRRLHGKKRSPAQSR